MRTVTAQLPVPAIETYPAPPSSHCQNPRLLQVMETLTWFAPSDLSVDAVTSTTVTLSWLDYYDRESGVEVDRASPVETRLNQDTELSPNTNYCYRLSTYAGIGRSEVSDYSEPVCAITTTSSEIPNVKKRTATGKRRYKVGCLIQVKI